jgi:hypothetical protein
MDYIQLKNIILNAPTFLMFNNMEEEFESLTSKRFSEGEIIWSLWTFFHKIRVALFTTYKVLDIMKLDLSVCNTEYPDFEKNFKLALEHITLPTYFYPRSPTQNPIILFIDTPKYFLLEFVFTNIVNLSILTKIMNGLAKPNTNEEYKTTLERDLTLKEFVGEIEAYIEEINIGLDILKSDLFLADTEEFFSLTWGIEIFDVYAENNNLMSYLNKKDAVQQILANEDEAIDSNWLKTETENYYYEMLISSISIYYTCKNNISQRNLLTFPGAPDLEITKFLDTYARKKHISKKKDRSILLENIDQRMVNLCVGTIQDYIAQGQINSAIKQSRDLYYNLMRIINSSYSILRHSFEGKQIYSDDVIRELSAKFCPDRKLARAVKVKERKIKKEEKTQEANIAVSSEKRVNRYRPSRQEVKAKASLTVAPSTVTVATQSPQPSPSQPTCRVKDYVPSIPDPQILLKADLEKFNQKLAELNKFKEQYDGITGKITALLKVMKDFEKPKAKLQQIQTSYKADVLNKVSSLNGEAKNILTAPAEELKKLLNRLLLILPDMEKYLHKVTMLLEPLKAKARRGSTVNKNSVLTETVKTTLVTKAQTKIEEKEERIRRRASDNLPRVVEAKEERPLLARRASDLGVRMQPVQSQEITVLIRRATAPVVEEKLKSSLNPQAPEFIPSFLRSPSVPVTSSQPSGSLPSSPLSPPLINRSQTDPILHYRDSSPLITPVSMSDSKVNEVYDEGDISDDAILALMDASIADAEEVEAKPDFSIDSDADDDLLAAIMDSSKLGLNEDETHLSPLSRPFTTDTIRFSIFNSTLFTVNTVTETKKEPASNDPWKTPDPASLSKW